MLREWKLNLSPRPEGQKLSYLDISRLLITEIRRGRLEAGDVLPGSRELASQLRVNRKTVIRAFDELVRQGWLTSEATRGTFVSAALPVSIQVQQASVRERGRDESPHFLSLSPPPDIAAVFRAPGVICLDDGVPDTRIFPTEAFARALRTGISMAGRRDRLGYGDPRGSLSLRDAVAKMLNQERGLAVTAANICITRGSQMALYVIGRTMLRGGDAIVVEALTYPAAREAFRSVGAEVLSVRLDQGGIDVEDLEEKCRKHKVRLVYLTPHHQYPTTVSLRPERRIRLMALASQFGFAVIEDDYDHEFHFDGRPLLPLASGNPEKSIYVGSMSKLLAPGLRIGFVAGPVAVIERIASEVLLIDRQGDPSTEFAVSELIESGELRRHANRARKVYAERRAAMGQLLKDVFGSRLSFNVPEGGLAFWIEFHRKEELQRFEEGAPLHGLRWTHSSAFASTDQAPKGLRLGFASLDEAEMGTVIRSMVKACG